MHPSKDTEVEKREGDKRAVFWHRGMIRVAAKLKTKLT